MKIFPVSLFAATLAGKHRHAKLVLARICRNPAARFILLFSIAQLAQGCATRPTTYEFKAGVTEAQYTSDETSCITLALDGYQADVAPAENAYHAPNAAGALGHGIGVGIVAGVARRKASETVHACMRDRGYSEPQVTDEQWRVLQKLDEAQSARARALMASGKDISSLLSN